MKPDLALCCITIITLILVMAAPVMAAEVNDEIIIHGWDIFDIITFFSTALAAILGCISFIGYRRDRRSKFLLVTLAFAIFALKGLLIITADIFASGHSFFDIIASLLDFLVLACIFLSITMK
jgi:hypothetical protein